MKTYPHYAVYTQEGGQLKHPYNLTRKVELDSLDEARHAAVNCWNKYRGKVDVVILKYTGPYQCTIVHVINRDEGVSD